MANGGGMEIVGEEVINLIIEAGLNEAGFIEADLIKHSDSD